MSAAPLFGIPRLGPDVTGLVSRQIFFTIEDAATAFQVLRAGPFATPARQRWKGSPEPVRHFGRGKESAIGSCFCHGHAGV